MMVKIVMIAVAFAVGAHAETLALDKDTVHWGELTIRSPTIAHALLRSAAPTRDP